MVLIRVWTTKKANIGGFDVTLGGYSTINKDVNVEVGTSARDQVPPQVSPNYVVLVGGATSIECAKLYPNSHHFGDNLISVSELWNCVDSWCRKSYSLNPPKLYGSRTEDNL